MPRGTEVVKHACDACRRRKIKCSGGKPCTHCLESELVCTSVSTRRKGGRSGRSANVLYELKAAQALSQTSDCSGDEVLIPTGPQPSYLNTAGQRPLPHGATGTVPNIAHNGGIAAFIRSPGLLSPDLIKCCTDYFFSRLDGTVPILHQASFQNHINNANVNLHDYCLVVAFCAFVLVQTGGGVTCSSASQKPGAPGVVHVQSPPSPSPSFSPQNEGIEDQLSDLEYGQSLLTEAIEARKHLELFTVSPRQSVLISFFLYGSHIGLGNQRHAYYYLREATTLYTSGILDAEPEEDAEHPSVAGKLFWLLLVSERAHAIRRHRPVTLQITPGSPLLQHGIDSENCTVGFRCLVNLYRPFDETFLGLWNGTNSSCSTDMIVWLDDHLLNAVPQSSEVPDVQMADLRVSQQWLRVMIWQLSTSLGLLSSNSSHNCMNFRYPLQIARDLAFSTWKLPLESMATHGIGLIEKVFDVACTLTDVISFLPPTETKSSSFDLGPQDYLNHFFSLICTLRGGKKRYLPLLLTKVAQTLPAMIQPIVQHLNLGPMAIQPQSETISSSLVSTSANVSGNEAEKDEEKQGGQNKNTAKYNSQDEAPDEWHSDDINYADISRIGDKTPEIATAFLHYSNDI